MRRPLPVVSAIGLLVGLSSCTVVTDRMRFHFDDERRGSFSLAAHARVGKSDNDEKENEEDPFHTKKTPLERAIEDKMKACGLSGLVFRVADDEHINARGSFNYPDELEMSLACIPSGWDVVRVQSKRDEGLLRDTYVTTIRLEQPRVDVDFADDDKVSLNSPDTFPRELSLTVPGTISDVHSDTDILGADFKTEEYGTQEVRAMLTERANADASENALVAKVKKEIASGLIDGTNVSKLPRNVYAVTVTSYQWRVKFQDILSIAGVLFGSGFLLQFIGSRLPAGKRRRQAAKRA
jgi:hypothetical protein